MLSAALAYAARGWPILPCRADKTPYTTAGVLDATTDAEIISAWWARWPGANVAVHAAGAGFLVLDYDPGSDREALAGELGLGTALIANTPRGGTHEYYLLPPGCEPVANSPLAPHIDVRSFHGYVLLPPSRTAAGSYSWEAEGEPALAGETLLLACRRRTRVSPERDEWLIDPDLPENRALAVKWLREEARLAVEGCGGDHATYAAAAMMKSFGLSEPTALEVLWEDWNHRCLPPWEHDALAVKVENAYRYNTSPPGNVTAAYHAAQIAQAFRPRVEEGGGGGLQVEAGRFRFADRRAVEDIPPPRWLIPDFLTEGGYGLLAGSRSSYKTFLALDAALTVASGGVPPWEGEWVGAWPVPERRGSVLYVVGEGRAGLRQRVRAWEKVRLGGAMVEGFVLGDPVPRVADGGDPLTAFCEGALRLRPGGYRMVVLDTIGRAMQGVNENAQEHASAFTALVERLQRDLGAAVLAVHHTGHENQGRSRGSSVFEADADTIVMVTREEAGRLRLDMTKQKEAREWGAPRWAIASEVRLGMDPDDTSLVTGAAPPKAAEEDSRESERRKLTFAVADARACEVLRAYPMREMTNADFARRMAAWRPEGGETLGVGAQVIRRVWLPRLQAEGCKAREWYDVGKDRWRYSGEAKEE